MIETTRSLVVELFRRNWLASTVLLWLAFAANLAAFYAIQSWLPTILVRLGQPPALAIGATVLTTIGGIIAATVIGPCMDRVSPFRTLGAVYVLGAVFVGLLGLVVGDGPVLLLTVAFLSGACVTGGQMSVIALATVLYPPKMRSTGVGWALGIGRLGGIASPLLVGAALGAGIAARGSISCSSRGPCRRRSERFCPGAPPEMTASRPNQAAPGTICPPCRAPPLYPGGGAHHYAEGAGKRSTAMPGQRTATTFSARPARSASVRR